MLEVRSSPDNVVSSPFDVVNGDKEVAALSKKVKEAVAKGAGKENRALYAASPRSGPPREIKGVAKGTPGRRQKILGSMMRATKPSSGSYMAHARRQAKLERLVGHVGDHRFADVLESELLRRVEEEGVEKCFTVVSLSVANLDPFGRIVFSDKQTVLEETFWSSAETKAGKSGQLVGVDKEGIAAVTGKETNPTNDHHSERAALIFLATRINTLVAGMSLSADSILIVRLSTLFASCAGCSKVLGEGDSVARAADELRGAIAIEPHVIISHKGAKPYSPSGKKRGRDTSPSEVRLSTSLSTKILKG